MTIKAPRPHGFLYAHIDTGLPGAREITRPGGGTISAAEGYNHFSDWIAAVNTAINADHGSEISWNRADGLVSFVAGVGGAFQFDRAGALIGLIDEPDTDLTFTSSETKKSKFVPAGAIWLMGAQYEQIELAREMKFDSFRWKRGYGYTWGGARIYRWRLTMHREALDAFNRGWCATGKVTLDMGVGTATSFTGTGYTGALTGHVIGVEGQGWLGPAADVAQVTLIVAGED